MTKPERQWQSSLFQISKWRNNVNNENYINYSLQKSFRVNDEWNKQIISSVSISELNRLNILINEVIKEHFIKSKDKENGE